MRHGLESFCAVVIGLVSFVVVVPLRCVDPHELAWTMRGDTATQVLGWLFFCDAPWSLPLGATDRYVAPVGSTLLMTDSLPPVAVVARVLGACRVGATQYLGLWLLACFVLQAVCAHRLARTLGLPVEQRLAVCLVCAFAPIFTWRTGHPTLCAHFVVLEAISLAVSAPTATTKRSLLPPAVLVLFTAMLHPYLLAMTAGFCGVAACRRPADRLVAVVIDIGVGAIGLWLVGAFDVDGRVSGYGNYATDVLDALDSGGAGRLMRPFSLIDAPREGVAYLGFGLLVGGGIGVVLWCRDRTRRAPSRIDRAGVFPPSVWGFAMACWLFAISTTVIVAGHVVLRAPGIAAALSPITSVFRASGRFVWPLWYLVAVVIVVAVGRLRRPRLLLTVLVALQLVDVAGTRAMRSAKSAPLLTDPRWSALAVDKTAVVLVPPILINARGARPPWPDLEIYTRFARLALAHGLSTNSGYLARPPNAALHRARDDVDTTLAAGTPDPDALYAFAPDDTRAFTRPSLCCWHLTDAVACVARSTMPTVPCDDDAR